MIVPVLVPAGTTKIIDGPVTAFRCIAGVAGASVKIGAGQTFALSSPCLYRAARGQAFRRLELTAAGADLVVEYVTDEQEPLDAPQGEPVVSPPQALQAQDAGGVLGPVQRTGAKLQVTMAGDTLSVNPQLPFTATLLNLLPAAEVVPIGGTFKQRFDAGRYREIWVAYSLTVDNALAVDASPQLLLRPVFSLAGVSVDAAGGLDITGKWDPILAGTSRTISGWIALGSGLEVSEAEGDVRHAYRPPLLELSFRGAPEGATTWSGRLTVFGVG